MTTPCRSLFLFAFLATACAAEEPYPFPPGEYDSGSMAKVNGDVILKKEVLARMGKKIKGLETTNAGKPEQFQKEFLQLFDDTLFQLVEEKVVAQKAKKYDITISDQELEVREAEEVKLRAGGDREKFKEMLAQNDLTLTEWHESLRSAMVMDIILSETMDRSSVFVQPESAVAYYKAHPAEFEHPARVRLRVLPIKARRGAEERATRLAESLRRQVEAGADFAGLAKWSDTDIVQEAPVDLEWRTREDLEPALADVVFKAEVGTFVGPVKGESGIYLARVEGREEATTISFDDAQEGIIAKMRGEKRWKATQAAILKLMTENVIEFQVPHLQREFERQKEALEGR